MTIKSKSHSTSFLNNLPELKGESERSRSTGALTHPGNPLHYAVHPGDTGNSIPTGPLTSLHVAQLRKEFGWNVIKSSNNPSWVVYLFQAVVHPFNILLCILATTSGALQEFDTMAIMLFMVIASAGLRFYQEYRSQRAAHSLRSLVSKKVHVLRKASEFEEAHEEEIPTEELVPGDWVKLNPGELIPADVIIHESKDLYVSQASLTGEAIPVEKFALTDANRSHYQTHLSTTNMSVASEDNGDSKYLNTTIISISTGTPKKNSNLKNFFRNIFGLRVGLESDGTDDRTKANLDYPNLCYMGTSVVTGVAVVIVQSTGSRTYFGSMAEELTKRRPQNAFQLGVRRISWIFFITMACLVPPVLLLQGFLNKDWSAALLFALSVAVGLTPEMLPMIVNTTLAKGAILMSRKKCIVKNLDAIVNMGGMDVLCTDKTGTLTKSVVVLTKHINQLGNPSKVPLNLAYLNAHFQSALASPLDEAVNHYYEHEYFQSTKILQTNETVFGCGRIPSFTDLVASFTKVDEVPFDFSRRRVSVCIKFADETLNRENILICKGAVEETLSICTKIFLDDCNENYFGVSTNEGDNVIPDETKVTEMTPELAEQLKNMSEDLNAEGLRVIAVAYKTLPLGTHVNGHTEHVINKQSECDMTFAGFIAFLDPPKESTRDAIQNLLKHKVEVKVLTGDSPSICKKICQEIGLPVKAIIRSSDLEGVSDDTVSALARRGTIFAKLTPLQKADIIKALKRNGNIVGFLGDGINDSPALTEADVGISVDTGTDIAKEAADIILLEKNIGVVVDGVTIGRSTYGNTLKYIVMAVSSNFGNVFSIMVASSWLPFLPMQPIHVLVQNLLYDISQIAIPWDHMDPEFLAVPHRWSMKSVLRFMVWMGPWSSVFDITTFIFMYFYFGIKTPSDNVILFQTTWFTVGLLTQTLIVHMIRTPKIPFVQSLASLPVVLMTVIIMGVGLALPYIPAVSTQLKMTPLAPMVYPYVAGALLCYCLAAQFAKMLYTIIFKEWF